MATEVQGVPERGTVIAGKYRVVDVLGMGGMGCVVSADHLLLKKKVAIKFVLANRSSATRGRLFREARAAQALSSENSVRVFDLGVHDEAPFIVMELLEGVDLASRIRDEGPLDVTEAVDCLLEACVAVAEAHAVGIIHRDIKPSNLFCARTSTQELVKVLDFGISKLPEAVVAEDCEKTQEGAVLGSPYFMSPEQLRNPASVDTRTDVWALAVTLYHLLTGELPFPGATVREVNAAVLADAPRDARTTRPEIPDALWAAIGGALTKLPEERTSTVGELADALLPFASKRGRLAAERAAAMRAPPPPVRFSRPQPATALTATDAAVSTTQSPSRRTPLPNAERGPGARRTTAVLVVAGLAVAGSFAWLVARPVPVAGDASPHPTTVAAQPLEPPPSSAPELASAAAREETAAAPATIATSPPKPPRAPRAAAATPAAPAPTPATPAASASAIPSPPPRPRLDIDGVPILR